MRVSILAVFATLALAVSVMPSAASAENGHVQATFTKWVVGDTFPIPMVGIVGGAVGAGTFTGQVLTDTINGTTEQIHAIYHINGAVRPLSRTTT
jgi:hypothetical protein